MTTTAQPVEYQPRHEWDDDPWGCPEETLAARLAILRQIGQSNPQHIGRHRADSCTCQAVDDSHSLGCRLVSDALKDLFKAMTA